MAYLLDTSVLIRFANGNDIHHADAVRAVLELHRQGEVLHITAQVLIEFRNVSTRPAAINGLGLSIADTEDLTEAFEGRFTLLDETPEIFVRWKSLVTSLGVIGKRVHDARLVAVCHAHGVSHLLTFNIADFAAMAAFSPGVVVVDPASV